MKTKITESELARRSASLREKMAQLESQQTDEGFFDAIKSGWNALTGGGQPAAAATPPAPAATPGTPAAGVAFNQGKPGEAPQAQAQAAAGPAGAPPKPAANAREQQYNRALKQIQDLYAKAKVQYPPQDDIIRQRFGLPPALPPLAQWDGKMPQSTGADFLTRNLFGRDGSKAVADQQAVNNISNTANAKSDAETEADVKQLGTLVAQLKAALAGKGPAPVSLSQAATPGTQAAGVAFNQGKAFGGYGQAPAAAAPGTQAAGVAFNQGAKAESLAESIARLNKKMRLMEYATPNQTVDPQQAAAQSAPPELDTTGKDDIIKKIQELMTKINGKIDGTEEDPPQDVVQALSDAQAAIEQFKAAAAENAKNGPPPVSLDQNNGVNAQGNNVTITNADGSTTNPETGITTPASTQPVNNTSSGYTGANGVNAQGNNVTITNADGSTTNPETGITTPASIIGNSPVVKASQSAAAPQRKYGGYGQATAESVSYRDDQALARIVELSRR
jgi:hypothetical protein